jgi:hypothetical protein
MIDDLFLRWVVIALFVLSAAECAYAITTGRRQWTHTIGHLLHFVMAVAMAVMAWPRGAALPTTGPMMFFLLATIWFVVIALIQSGHRTINAYHASMMLAMVWMYAVMSGDLVPAPSEGAGHGGGHAGHHASSMPGASGMSDPADPPFITGLNWVCAAGFALATVWWLYRCFVEREESSHRVLGITAQAMMAAGMAITFGVML